MTSLNKTFTTSGTTNYITIRFAVNTGNYLTTKNIQLEEGTSATEYIPYGKYKIPVTVSGKNMWTTNITYPVTSLGHELINYDSATQIFTLNEAYNGKSQSIYKLKNPIPAGTKVTVYMYVLEGNIDGTIVFGGYHNGDDNKSWQGAINLSENRNEDLSGKVFKNTYVTTNTVTDFWAFLNLGYQINSSLKFKMMYVIGDDESNDFEPYQETVTKNIYLDEPLRKIGEYADYVDFKEQKVVRKIYSQDVVNYNVNLNYLAAERWQREGATSFYMSNFLKYESLAQGKPHSISNRFKDGIYWEWKDIATPYNYLMAGSKNTILYIIIENKFLNNITADSSETEKLSAFKEYLDNNLITVNYVMNTPIEKRILLPSFETNNGINYFKVGTATSASNIDIIS